MSEVSGQDTSLKVVAVQVFPAFGPGRGSLGRPGTVPVSSRAVPELVGPAATDRGCRSENGAWVHRVEGREREGCI